MVRKSRISFDLRKYVEKHCNVRSECTKNKENRASHNTDCNASDLIDFFGDHWKGIRTQIEKINIYILKKNSTD